MDQDEHYPTAQIPRTSGGQNRTLTCFSPLVWSTRVKSKGNCRAAFGSSVIVTPSEEHSDRRRSLLRILLSLSAPLHGISASTLPGCSLTAHNNKQHPHGACESTSRRAAPDQLTNMIEMIDRQKHRTSARNMCGCWSPTIYYGLILG